MQRKITESEFFLAIRDHNVGTYQLYLEQNADDPSRLQIYNKDGETPLIALIKSLPADQNTAILVQVMALAEKVDLNQLSHENPPETALQVAGKKNFKNIVKLLSDLNAMKLRMIDKSDSYSYYLDDKDIVALEKSESDYDLAKNDTFFSKKPVVSATQMPKTITTNTIPTPAEVEIQVNTRNFLALLKEKDHNVNNLKKIGDFLISIGQDSQLINKTDKDGNSALHLIVLNYPSLIDRLLWTQINFAHKNNAGQTANSLAIQLKRSPQDIKNTSYHSADTPKPRYK